MPAFWGKMARLVAILEKHDVSLLAFQGAVAPARRPPPIIEARGLETVIP